MFDKDVKVDKLADVTDGYVGADIEALCREAAMNALRQDEGAKTVGMKNFENAMRNMNPTMTEEVVKQYEKILKEFSKRSTKKMSSDVTRYLG